MAVALLNLVGDFIQLVLDSVDHTERSHRCCAGLPVSAGWRTGEEGALRAPRNLVSDRRTIFWLLWFV